MRRRVPELDPRALRNSLGLNQSEFWGRIGVTQSGGSRYENGRRLPPPVRKLLGIVYLKKKY
jgi:transcriptional regulator with XRE-family HTH domain